MWRRSFGREDAAYNHKNRDEYRQRYEDVVGQRGVGHTGRVRGEHRNRRACAHGVDRAQFVNQLPDAHRVDRRFVTSLLQSSS